MVTTNSLLSATLGINGQELLEAGETSTAREGRRICFVTPVNGAATIETVTGGDASFDKELVLLEGIPFAIACDTIKLGSGSAGDLVLHYL